MSSEPVRLHPAAMLLSGVTNARRWASAAVFPALAALFSGGPDAGRLVFVLAAMGIGMLVAAVWGVLSWYFTTYWVAGGAFYLRRGVIGKNERSIPLEHIQSVDVVQGVLQRLLGVVEIRIETAGGRQGQPDASLSSLSRDVAAALQRELAVARPLGADSRTDTPEPVTVRRLGAGRLLVAGATSGQIGVVLPLIGAATQIFDDILSQDQVISLSQRLLPNSAVTVIVIVLALLVVAWLISILGTVLAYTGFTLSRDGDNLHIRRGLLERRDVTIPLNRIQAVRAVEGLLRQPFGLVLLRMDSAGYGANAGVSTTLFPLLRRDEVSGFLRVMAPEFAAAAELQPLPRRSLRRYVLRELIPLLLLLAPCVAGLILLPGDYRNAPWASLAAGYGALLLVAGAYGWLQFKGAGWAVAGDHLVLRFRRLARTTVIAPRRRLQSRSVRQSPFQRRVGLATLGVQVASGGGGSSFNLVDIEMGDARVAVEQLGPAAATRKQA